MTESSQPKNTELIPSKGTEFVGEKITEIMEEIIQFRDDQKLPENCVRYYKLRKNKHWRYKDKNTKLIEANLLGRHHQSTTNMLTDNNPTFNAVQIGDIQEGAAEQLNILVNTSDAWWIDTEQQHIFETSVSMCEQNGTAGEFLSFNQQINFPDGEVESESMDIMYYSLYPPEVRERDKAEAFLRWYPKTVREVKRLWPETGKDVVGDTSLLEDIKDTRNEDDYNNTIGALRKTVIAGLTKFLTGTSPTRTDSDAVFVIEVWVKDYSEKEDGSPVYPGNIRRIQTCNGGQIILDDSYNPSLNPDVPDDENQKLYLYSRFPMSHNQSVTNPYSPFGYSDFEQLEKLNMEINQTLSQIKEFKDKTSKVKFINPKDSGVPDSHLDNLSGIVSPTNHMVAQGIRFMNPPQVSPDLLAGLEIYKSFFDDVAGTFTNVLQGQQQGASVVAYKAIAALLEESGRMARGKTRNYSKMLRERGRMFISLAQSFSAPRFVNFQVEGQDQTKEITAQQLRNIPGKISVINGSTMPRSLIQKREEALSLAQGGYIDQKEVLEAYDWNNSQEVIDRMQAGVFGQLYEAMGQLGFPQQIIQLLQAVTKMKPEQLEKAIKDGKIPNFMQIVKALSGEQPPDFESIKLQIEIQKADAEVDKIEAETAETNSKVNKNNAQQEYYLEQAKSERMDQYVKHQGVKFDKEKLKIMRAETVSNLKTEASNRKEKRVETIAGISDRNRKSDAVEEKNVIETKKVEKGERTYQERGLTSNNVD